MPSRKQENDENDFAFLDRLAKSLTTRVMRPLSPTLRVRWQAARRGQAKATNVSQDKFDARQQAEVLANLKSIRERLARKGIKFTPKEIKAAIEKGRH